MTSLDQWTTQKAEVKKPLVINDAHANYLYETSYEKQLEKHYDDLIKSKLAEEKAEKVKEMKQYAKYVESNYIRVGV